MSIIMYELKFGNWMYLGFFENVCMSRNKMEKSTECR